MHGVFARRSCSTLAGSQVGSVGASAGDCCHSPPARTYPRVDRLTAPDGRTFVRQRSRFELASPSHRRAFGRAAPSGELNPLLHTPPRRNAKHSRPRRNSATTPMLRQPRVRFDSAVADGMSRGSTTGGVKVRPRPMNGGPQRRCGTLCRPCRGVPRSPAARLSLARRTPERIFDMRRALEEALSRTRTTADPARPRALWIDSGRRRSRCPRGRRHPADRGTPLLEVRGTPRSPGPPRSDARTARAGWTEPLGL